MCRRAFLRLAVSAQRNARDRLLLDFLDRDAATRRAARVEGGDAIRGHTTWGNAVDADRRDLRDE